MMMESLNIEIAFPVIYGIQRELKKKYLKNISTTHLKPKNIHIRHFVPFWGAIVVVTVEAHSRVIAYCLG